MFRCLDLARLGTGTVALNPRVGAVIVNPEGKVAGEGYHQAFGGPHAEVNAITRAKSKTSDLSKCHLFVTLEPCHFRGKTPACTDLIGQEKITQISVGCSDPNPRVSGQGLDLLRRTGHLVEEGVMLGQCRNMIRRFAVNQQEARPYIILKWAQSRDGFIGRTGERIKISNPFTDRLVHKWRSQCDAVMVGTNTAIIDNPLLTTRLVPGRNPLRIALDRREKIPKSHHLFDGGSSTLIITEKPEYSFANTLQIKFDNEFIINMLHNLYERGIASVMVEGGTLLLQSFIDLKLWDEYRIIINSQPLKYGIKAPQLSKDLLVGETGISDDRIYMGYMKSTIGPKVTRVS